MAGDFGLAKVARLLGKEEAYAIYMQAAGAEEDGDFGVAVASYRRAYRLWDALDSALGEGGLPVAVRREAEAQGVDCGGGAAEVRMETDAPPRFDVEDADEWLAYLRDNGYCVLAGVADADAVGRAKALFWDFLESVPDTGVRRSEPSTWCRESGWLPDPQNGILGVHGVGQSDFCWHARLLPRVGRAFAAIWGTGDLLVSFDGANAFRPWAGRPEWKTSGGWWHVDQNDFKEDGAGFRCVQGLVTFTDATPATGGLCVVPGSHKHHHSVCANANAQILSGHYVRAEPADPVFGLGARLVCAEAGDLVLWDSRCVHCNTPGVAADDPGARGPDAGAGELLRIAAYVCMTPSAWASEEVRAQRLRGFIGNQTCDHVPHRWHGSLGAADEPWPPPRVWTDAPDLQKRLVVGRT